jgi:hypothetical protein
MAVGDEDTFGEVAVRVFDLKVVDELAPAAQPVDADDLARVAARIEATTPARS